MLKTFVEILATYFREHRSIKQIAVFISIFALFIIMGVIVFGMYYLLPAALSIDSIVRLATSSLTVGGVFAAPFIILLYATLIASSPQQGDELAPIRKEREEIRDRIKEKEPDIFDTIQLNLNQLSEYYTINKSQARNSFRASVTAIIVGFLTIIVGIWVFYLPGHPIPNLTYMSVIGGILLQFIGGAYFYLYNKSLAQLNFFFARLTIMQDTMLSIKLCDQIAELPTKAKILEELIFEIIKRGRSVPPSIEEKTTGKSRKAMGQARKAKEQPELTMTTAQTPRAA